MSRRLNLEHEEAEALAVRHQASSSQAVSRDEFGYRYDAQGNRIDARGRVVAAPVNRY